MQILSLLPIELQQSQETSSIETLEHKILEKLRHNSNELMNILYRIDISENKLSKAFEYKEDIKIASEIAKLIVERLEQKLEMRKKYGSI